MSGQGGWGGGILARMGNSDEDGWERFLGFWGWVEGRVGGRSKGEWGERSKRRGREREEREGGRGRLGGTGGKGLRGRVGRVLGMQRRESGEREWGGEREGR